MLNRAPAPTEKLCTLSQLSGRPRRGTVELGWTPVPTATHYELERRTKGQGNFSYGEIPGDQWSFRATGLAFDVPYLFALRACDDSRCGDWTTHNVELARNTGRTRLSQ